MTTPEFIAWLDAKMAAHGEGKLIPPDDVVEQEFEQHLENEMREVVVERILREAGLEEQLAAALGEVTRPSSADLGTLKLDTPLPVSAFAAVQHPTKLGLKANQTLAVEEAIRGLVTKSANDAAVVVSEAIAGAKQNSQAS